MGLQSRVPMLQTPFLGVLGLYYVQQSHSEAFPGPKPASKGKSPLMVIVAVNARPKGRKGTQNGTATYRIRERCDPSAPIPPAVPHAPTQARNAPNARNRNAQSSISPNFISLPRIPVYQT